MKKLEFCVLDKNDIAEMAEMENKYFGDYERAFNYDFLERWFNVNSKMYYGIKIEGKLVCFTVFVPVTEELHNKLLEGVVSDLYDFDYNEVCSENDSKYFYLADIVVDEMSSTTSMMSVGLLIKTIIKMYKDSVEYVTTSPITKNGLKITEHVGFEKVAEQVFNNETYDVYLLDVNKKINNSKGAKIKK